MSAGPLYRIVSVLLVGGDGRVLLRHGDSIDAVASARWSFPGGEVAAGETPHAAARRIIAGETGHVPMSPLVLFGQHVLARPAPWADMIEWFGFCAATSTRPDAGDTGEGGAAFVAPEDALVLDLHPPFALLLRAFLTSEEYRECRERAARGAGGAT